MIDDWYAALNENEIIVTCFLDISKYFDTINHDLRMHWFKYYGVMNYDYNRLHHALLSGHIKQIVCKSLRTTGVNTWLIKSVIIHIIFNPTIGVAFIDVCR